jgi:hypothetical protein
LEVAVIDREGRAGEWDEWPDKEFRVIWGWPVRLQPNESLGLKLGMENGLD